MPSPRRFALLWVLTLLFLGGVSGFSQTYNKIVVFGDSLSDTGNIAHLVQNANPLGIRYPADNQLLGFDYTDGRFTDGADTQPAASTAYTGVWIEQLAASFASKPAVKNSLDGGTNYAFGDATTANGTYTRSTTSGGLAFTITIENMGQQVTDYLNTNPTPNAQTLYVLWGGANEIYSASDAGTDPNAAATTAVQNELALVQRLIAEGATSFMLPNLPQLGEVPNYASSGAATALNNASGVFAQALAQGIASLKLSALAQGKTITVYQPDVFDKFLTLTGGPMSVGLSNSRTAAQNVYYPSPDTNLSWDGLHPTTTGHHFAAATAANLITPLVASTTTLTVPAYALVGQSFRVSAKVSSTASSAVPAGLVTFFSGGVLLGSAALDGTGTVNIDLSPLTLTGGGVRAVYLGDTTFNGNTAPAQPVVVAYAPAVTITNVSSSNLNANLNSSVTFTATVMATQFGPASGTVTFLDGSATLGTGTLNGSGVATYTTSALTAGTHSITATYAGAGVFSGSTSAAINQLITAPSLTIAALPTTLTVIAGNSGTTTLTATSVGGYAGTFTLSCGALPAHLACSFSTTTLTLSSNATSQSSTLTIATNATAALAIPQRPGVMSVPRVVAATLVFPALGGLLFFGVGRRRRMAAALRLSAGLVVLTAGACFGLTGCGGNNNAARGTYTVPVLFTPATGTAQTVNVTVTVQ